MSIKSELHKEGIVVIKQLNTINVNSIATNIAKKIVISFPEQNFSYSEIFKKISRLNMYIAKIPNGIAAKYFYKNSSIYFSEYTDLENLNEVIIHECIHAIQTKINSKNELIKLGLCDFTDSKLSGMALNEAAVQLMTMKCCKSKFNTVKYFNLDIPSNSPDYYTLECNLVRQMTFITGEHTLYNSTLLGNDSFKNKFISLTSKNDFEIIKSNINYIMYLEDKLNIILQKIQNSSKSSKQLIDKTDKIKKEIKNEFLLTQNKIFTSFFNKRFSLVSNTTTSIESFRKSLYNYRKLIGVSNDYTFFNEYYINKMCELDNKFNANNSKSLALIPIKETFLSRIVRKIYSLVILKDGYDYEKNTN